MTLRPGVDLSLAELLAMRAVGTHVKPGRVRPAQDGQSTNQPVSRGLDVSEVRRYQAGDEVRAIDWKVTARRGETHVKVFEDERAKPVYLLIDLRSLMRFGTRVCFKSVLAARLSAALAWRALAAGDRVGAWIVTDKTIHRLAERAGDVAVRSLCHALVRHHRAPEDAQTVSLMDAVEGMGGGRFRKAEWHLISDFCDTPFDLSRLRAMDVTCWHLLDPVDAQLPARSGWIRDRTGLGRLPAGAAARKRHAARHAHNVEQVKHLCSAAGGRYRQLGTEQGEPVSIRRALLSGALR